MGYIWGTPILKHAQMAPTVKLRDYRDAGADNGQQQDVSDPPGGPGNRAQGIGSIALSPKP